VRASDSSGKSAQGSSLSTTKPSSIDRDREEGRTEREKERKKEKKERTN
jgi:hypothetical protein